MAPNKRTTKEKGLGNRHRLQVEYLKSVHVEGTICWWCGEPMFLAQGLSGDHSIPRSQGGTVADRLLHGPCNSERGDGRRDHLRPALVGRRPPTNLDELGTLVMRWPWSRHDQHA
ncbi:hypothetical protein NM962_01250 [Mycobacterium sp. SVM_VP21]|nr:hypothetical protein NM962_01250 [Mycobacterium sp. SVM_VP21]